MRYFRLITVSCCSLLVFSVMFGSNESVNADTRRQKLDKATQLKLSGQFSGDISDLSNEQLESYFDIPTVALIGDDHPIGFCNCECKIENIRVGGIFIIEDSTANDCAAMNGAPCQTHGKLNCFWTEESLFPG